MTNSTIYNLFPPRWRELAACAQFTIHNSHTRPTRLPIQNSKFRIQNSHPHHYGCKDNFFYLYYQDIVPPQLQKIFLNTLTLYKQYRNSEGLANNKRRISEQ